MVKGDAAATGVIVVAGRSYNNDVDDKLEHVAELLVDDEATELLGVCNWTTAGIPCCNAFVTVLSFVSSFASKC